MNILDDSTGDGYRKTPKIITLTKETNSDIVLPFSSLVF
jgi:hypothetical protein